MSSLDSHRQGTRFERETARAEAAGTVTTPQSDDRRIRSDALFCGARELLIEHGDLVYRLRITGQDKLILTK